MGPTSRERSECARWGMKPNPRDPNSRKSGESAKQWGARMRIKFMDLVYKDPGRPQNLMQCRLLYHDLLQVDPKAFTGGLLTKE